MPMTEAYKQHFHAMRSDDGYTEALYDDVDEVVRRLAARDDILLGTATGKALRGIRWLIDRNGWHGFSPRSRAPTRPPPSPHPRWF